VLLGAIAGLIVLVRHTNIVFTLVWLLYGVGTHSTVSSLAARLWGARAQVARIAAVAALVIAPQLLLYHQATGQLIVSSYGALGFNWTSPRIAGVLFSVQKGLFFWSPLLLLATAGLVILARSARPAAAFAVPGALFLAVNTYLIASWWDWQFGGSYGHRGFVDALPLFGLGLAAMFERVSHSASARVTVAIAVAALVSLSIFQMLQYWHGLIPFNDTTWPQYRELFLHWR
jgi:hypothetical protein